MSVGHLNDMSVVVNDGFESVNDHSALSAVAVVENELVLQQTDGGKCVEDSNVSIADGDGENVCLVSSSSDVGGESFVMKVPRANSKLILQNMEEVLNSVKKKHRQKHRRKREQKKLAMMAEALGQVEVAGQQLVNDGEAALMSTVSADGNLNACNSGSIAKKSVKKPLQEQQAVQDVHSSHSNVNVNGKSKHHNNKRRKASISPSKSTVSAEACVNTNGLLQHVVRTPRKNQDNCIDTTQRKVQEHFAVEHKSTPTVKPATNAFEVMMNARNKTIGSNTPGKEVSNTDGSPAGSNAANAKRKLMLQSWAERKGGLKRKLDDDMRGAYIEERLDDRAKRLKRMLTTGSSPRGATGSAKVTSSETESKKEKPPSSGGSNKTSSRRSKTSSRRSRRLSSVDSVESNTEKQIPLDPETVEFLSKLSSPTKKRDSLLGYFNKIPSPNDVTIGKPAATTPASSTVVNAKIQQKHINDSSTPKRRGRPPKVKLQKPPNEDDEEAKSLENSECVAEHQTPTSSIRPKRACAEKPKYDYDLHVAESPEKERSNPIKIANDEQQRSKRKPKRGSPLNNDVADEAVVIDLDSSTSFNVSQDTKTPKKLAPLFMRSVPKPSVDPEALKARQEFLRSGVPDILKLEQDKQKLYDQCYEEAIELFPKIAHLHQWTHEEGKFLEEISSSSKSFSLRKMEESFDALVDSTRANGNGRKAKIAKGRNSLIGITNCAIRDFRPDKKSSKNTIAFNGTLAMAQQFVAGHLPMVNNKRLIIKAWKADFDRFPTYKCYNQLRTKYRFFSALDSTQDTEQVTESFVVTRSTRRSLEGSSMSNVSQRNSDSYLEEDVKPPATAPNGELLFTEKYKPMLFEQVLVNLTPVSQLRDFLANWANGNGNGTGSSKNSQNLADDSMDFMNDSSSSQQASCNSVVLLGPASSGKTNAVFTLANEMNFNVLEINAGMKRTGKKLIQELLEATQSHQIRNESAGGSAVKSKAQKNLLKMSLKSLKGKKQISSNSNGTGTGNGNGNDSETEMATVTDLNVRKCLILIEDADIVFDQTDAGFTDAVYTLAASSKRPVIVIATNPNCQHLQRLMAQNTIKFTAPNALSISKYLAVLSLMENCPISLDDLISLYLYNQNDLRKTLHELQFFIQSGGDFNRQLNGNGNGIHSPLKQSMQKERKTPQKETADGDKLVAGKYFASPGKRRLSEDSQTQSGAVHDEQLKRESNTNNKKEQSSQEGDYYLHRTLFEFYTVDQNAKWRVPFPVNFDLFYANMRDIFAMAKKLKSRDKDGPMDDDDDDDVNTNSKRKTRSPKKIWLSTATATANKLVSEKCISSHSFENLNSLSSFYNNISVATLVVARDESKVSNSNGSQYERDRLMPYLSESIAHDLLEQAISVNLEAEPCPYNLFEAQKKCATLSDLMGPTVVMLPKRARFMDFEPALRAICRSEQQRALQERRSTRFYHYLRNSCVEICNFSQRPFEDVCSVFQWQQEQSEVERAREQNNSDIENS